MEDARRMVLYGLCAALLAATPTLAEESDGADLVTALQAKLAAQQAQIDALEQQVAASAQADMDQARAEQMKRQIREVLSEREFRETLAPSTLQAGYDNGFFIRSSDGKFRMQFNALAQFRWTYYATRDENRYLLPGFKTSRNRAGFDMQRIDFTISGHAYTEDLTYNLELGSGTPNGYGTGVNYAWINYRFDDAFQVRTGIINLKSTRSATFAFSTYQLIDNPVFDAVFGLGDGLGVRIWGDLMEGQGTYYLDIANTLGGFGSATITNDENLYTAGHDNNPAVVFRTVWALLGGTCLNPNDEPEYVVPCDLAWHEEPALNVGFHYGYTEDWHDGTLRIPYARQTFFRDGGFGLTSSDGLQIHQFGLDMGFKWQGFSLLGEYAFRILDVRSSSSAPFTPLFLATGDDSTNVQHGAYLQAGYFLPIPGHERKFEVVGRVGGITANAGGLEGTWEYAGGLNYYIDGHRVKLQADVTHVTEVPTTSSPHSLANVNDDAWIFRMQLQLAF